MSTLAVTNTFVPGQTASATQVNTNFSDIVTYVNARNTASSSWESLSVSGNGSITGNLTVGGTISVTGTASITGAVSLTAGVTPNFTSAETAIGAAGTTTSFTHGLSGVPRNFIIVMRCKTAELTYSVGDEVVVTGSMNAGIASVWANSTTCNITTQTSFGTPSVVRRDTFATAAITVGNWKYVCRAWI